MRGVWNHIFHLRRHNSFGVACFGFRGMRIGRAGNPANFFHSDCRHARRNMPIILQSMRALFDARPVTITIANVEALMAT